MSRLPNIATLKVTLWVGYLFLSLLFAQGLGLHVHVYNHEPVSSSDVHVEQVHLAVTSGAPHSDLAIAVDLTLDGITKNIPVELHFAFVLLAVAFAVGAASRLRQVTPSWRFKPVLKPWLGSFPPPLRSPPV